MENNIKINQIELCEKYDTRFYETPFNLKVGVAYNLKNLSLYPINGLRHNPEGDTTGWYIWAGEDLSDDPNFFAPLHLEHLLKWRPEVLKFLGLPPGFRFLIGNKSYEDVWYDETLI
jgi:hypothetical protein